MTAVNVTFSLNYAAVGGAIASFGTLTATNVTISRNTAQAGGGIATGNGLTLFNTIVAGNRATVSPTYPDIAGPVVSSSASNFIGDGTGMTGISNADANNNHVGTSANVLDPKLDPNGMKHNGGPTPTIALTAASPAVIHAGRTGAGIPTTDQRGARRPSNNIDLGAYQDVSMRIGVYRPGTQTFLLDTNGNGKYDGPAIDRTFAFGISGDIPIAGDWNGNLKTKIGVYRPSNRAFYLDYNGNGSWDGPVVDRVHFFGGNAGDAPIVGDWNGDGKFDIGVYRDSNGGFYVDQNGNGRWDGPVVDRVYFFGGTTGDMPIIGDWSGDGTTKIGLYRPSNHTFYLDLNGNGQWDGASIDGQFRFGTSGDLPVVGNWDTSIVGKLAAPGLKTEIGVFRPSSATFCLDLQGNNEWDGATFEGVFAFGEGSDRPLAGRWD